MTSITKSSSLHFASHTLRASAFLGILIMGLGLAQAIASVTYTYTGLNFTSVTGSSPQVTTNNHFSGFVTFADVPTPGSTLYDITNVTAFSFSDGVRTLSSAAGDHEFFHGDFFSFDSSWNLVNWQFSCVPDSQTGNGNQMYTTPSFEQSRLNAGATQSAVNSGGGAWLTPTNVPEPGSLGLLALGGLMLLRGRTRLH